MEIKIFLQSESLKDISVLTVDSSIDSESLHKICRNLLPPSVNKNEFQLTFEDDDDGQLIEGTRNISDGTVFHLHRLKFIDVQVLYAGREVKRNFRPNATIGRIKRWAARELGILPSDATELMLQLCGTNARPDIDVHLGTLVIFPEKSICFDLVPSPRING